MFRRNINPPAVDLSGPSVIYPAPTQCSVCSTELHITRLQCGACGTAIEGKFTGGALTRLTRDQLQFVELFLRCRGKIKGVEEALGISYPTVVARLNEVLRALGIETQPEDEPDRLTKRQAVLDDLAAGRINAEEAAGRLRGLDGGRS